MSDEPFGQQLEKLLTSYLTATKLGRLGGVAINEGGYREPWSPSLAIIWHPDDPHIQSIAASGMRRAEVEIYLQSCGREEEQAAAVGQWLAELMEILSVGPVGTVTADLAAHALTLRGHGFQKGDEVCFTTSGILPGNLEVKTTYTVRDCSWNAFRVAATAEGEAIDLADSGRGRHRVRSAAGPFAYFLATAKATTELNLEGVYLMETMTGMEGDHWVASLTLKIEGAPAEMLLEAAVRE